MADIGERKGFKLTIGALAKCNEVSPLPVLLAAFKAEIWTLQELQVVIDSAFEAADEKPASGDLIEEHGIAACKDFAHALMVEAFKFAEKKSDVSETGTETPSQNEPT